MSFSCSCLLELLLSLCKEYSARRFYQFFLPTRRVYIEYAVSQDNWKGFGCNF